MMKNTFVPKEFLSSHDYCLFLHGQLVEILKSGEKAGIFNINIKFKSTSEIHEINVLSGEELIEWLEKNNYKEEVWLLYYKQVCAALLSDFLHFVYEVLQCSRKGRLTVAYALLRKPFKENLLYLEWLLADPGDFLSRFDSERTNRFSFPADVSKDRKTEIIREAMKKTKYEQWLSPEFLYELRYDKKARYGLEILWQKANHLITTFNYMETEKSNFNFVFSNEEHMYSQWKQIYSFLPLLLFHAVQIIEALIANFADRIRVNNDTTPLQMDIGLLLWMQDGPWQAYVVDLEREANELFKRMNIKCSSCGNAFEGNKKNLEDWYLKGTMRCRMCGNEESVI